MAKASPRRKAAIAALILLLLLLLAWWLFSRKDAPPASAGTPLAEFGAPRKVSRIPLCPGLQIVTAISQPDGDYESIKTIEAVTKDAVRIRYSSEGRIGDVFADDYGKLKLMTVVRSVRTEDMANATFYAQRFFEKMPEIIPESTAIGTSTAVLNTLKTGDGAGQLNVSVAYGGEPGIDRNVRPSIYDYMAYGTTKRTGTEPVVVLLDDTLALVPAVQARVEFVDQSAEFSFLDDPSNSMTLAFRLGIQPGASRPPETLGMVKIVHMCGPDAATANAAAPDISAELAKSGRVAIYDIHFKFGTGEIREESTPRLDEIAAMLKANPSWRLRLEGHTDSVGEAAANLDISRKRAEALKAALISQYSVDATRLEAVGLGSAHPRDSNATAEGRARNRRIEIQRL